MTEEEHTEFQQLISMLTARICGSKVNDNGSRTLIVKDGEGENDWLERRVSHEAFKVLNQLDDALHQEVHDSKDRSADYR
jgi:hypothetical protein